MNNNAQNNGAHRSANADASSPLGLGRARHAPANGQGTRSPAPARRPADRPFASGAAGPSASGQTNPAGPADGPATTRGFVAATIPRQPRRNATTPQAAPPEAAPRVSLAAAHAAAAAARAARAAATRPSALGRLFAGEHVRTPGGPVGTNRRPDGPILPGRAGGRPSEPRPRSEGEGGATVEGEREWSERLGGRGGREASASR
jgi:hypothetical protein